MNIPLIVLIVCACGTSVLGLRCFRCGRNGAGKIEGNDGELLHYCVGSSSYTMECPEGQLSCWSATGGGGVSEIRGCADEQTCQTNERNPEDVPADQLRCCYTELCNDDSLLPSTEKATVHSFGTRITISWKMLLLTLISMYTYINKTKE